jgi:hypothetical protein
MASASNLGEVIYDANFMGHFLDAFFIVLSYRLNRIDEHIEFKRKMASRALTYTSSNILKMSGNGAILIFVSG